MTQIPSQLAASLKNVEPRYIRVAPRSKQPVDNGWQKRENWMSADNPTLIEWLSQGGNYGVATGFGLGILDADHQDVRSLVESNFPESTMVETPGHKGLQYYFLSDLTRKVFLRTSNGEHAGEILTEGFMGVGPGSIHPNGQEYKLRSAAPLAKLSNSDLSKLLGTHLVPAKEVAQTERTAASERKTALDIRKVVPLQGLTKQGDEYYGPHPVHGSETGHNFWVNPSKNCWHCFRHESGGGPLLWLAVETKLVSCESAGPGILRGKLFKDALQIASERGYLPKQAPKPTEPLDETSQASKIVNRFLSEQPLLFHDERHVSYARLRNSPSQILRLRTTEMRPKLAGLLWEAEGKVPGSEAVSSALNVLQFLASKGPMHPLNNRVAWHDDVIWLDLTDENWRAVRITEKDWTIEVEPPTLFRRYPSQLPLPTPVHGGNPWKLLAYVNVRQRDQLLFMVYVATLFIPGIPHVILLLHGPQGSTKTTLQTLVKDLVDPSAIGVSTLPRDERELIQALDHAYLNYFDNVSSLNPWISDALCRATTGAGFSKRQLYTDDEDVIYRLQRPIGMNGINVTAERPDLLDRCILIELDSVPDEKRRQLREVQAKFREDLPNVLGGFLDTIVKALMFPEPTLDRTHRMADFLSWGCRIAVALGRSDEKFLLAYEENIREAAEEATRADVVAEVLLEYLDATKDRAWEGSATALLGELRLKADKLHISTRQKEWPKGSNALTRRLRRLKDSLSRIGYNIEFTRGRHRLISIAFEAGKVSKIPSKSSTPSRHERFSDDIDDVDDTSGSFPVIALDVLRRILGPFSDDYAVEQLMKSGVGRTEAEVLLTRFISEGLLATDPQGYLRLVK
jgi:hypothetical protein